MHNESVYFITALRHLGHYRGVPPARVLGGWGGGGAAGDIAGGAIESGEEREKGTMKKVGVFLFGAFMNVCFVAKEDLLKKDVRYLGTDTEESEMDLYEDIQTGEIFATKL